jgi:hypothetical protein
VLLHLPDLIRVEAPGILENRIADSDLSNIVELGGNAKAVALALKSGTLKSTASRPLVKDHQ